MPRVGSWNVHTMASFTLLAAALSQYALHVSVRNAHNKGECFVQHELFRGHAALRTAFRITSEIPEVDCFSARLRIRVLRHVGDLKRKHKAKIGKNGGAHATSSSSVFLALESSPHENGRIGFHSSAGPVEAISAKTHTQQTKQAMMGC